MHSGIGLETVIQFAHEGASVVCADINEKAAQHAVELFSKVEGAKKAIVAITDVSKEGDIKAAVDLAVSTFGRLDIMFNNAGIMHPADDNALTTEEKVWDLTMNINLKGVWFGCKHAIDAMRKNPGGSKGSIINTASFVAILGAATPQLACMSFWLVVVHAPSLTRTPRHCRHRLKGALKPVRNASQSLADRRSVTQGGVLAMTRELAMVHAREGIRINSLCPGPLKTELLMKFLDTPEKKERRMVHIPMGRFGEAIEQAKSVVFLASDESSFITGTDFKVDGGISSCYVVRRLFLRAPDTS